MCVGGKNKKCVCVGGGMRTRNVCVCGGRENKKCVCVWGGVRTRKLAKVSIWVGLSCPEVMWSITALCSGQVCQELLWKMQTFSWLKLISSTAYR